jgi:hypothetical protein
MCDWDDAFAADCYDTSKAALMARLAEEGYRRDGRGALLLRVCCRCCCLAGWLAAKCLCPTIRVPLAPPLVLSQQFCPALGTHINRLPARALTLRPCPAMPAPICRLCVCAEHPGAAGAQGRRRWLQGVWRRGCACSRARWAALAVRPPREWWMECHRGSASWPETARRETKRG